VDSVEAVADEIIFDRHSVAWTLRLIGLRRRHRERLDRKQRLANSAPIAPCLRVAFQPDQRGLAPLDNGVGGGKGGRRFEAANLFGVPLNAILDRLKDIRPDNIVLILGGKLAIYHGVNLSV
jgi:hypothetical protein